MSTTSLIWRQFRCDQKTFWRDPTAVFFTVALPLIFLFLFVSIFGNEPTRVDGGTVPGATYYVPGIIVLAVVSATTVNLAISLTALRERGIFKRVRSTPLPPWVFMAGRIGTATVVSALLVGTVVLLGRVVYGVEVPTNTLPGLVLSLVVGTIAFCSLGFALTAAIPSENAAPAVTNAVVLPMYFISGVFIPEGNLPQAMKSISDIFPVKHLFNSVLTAFDPSTTGSGIVWGDVAVLAAWGVAGLLVANCYFRWAPHEGS